MVLRDQESLTLAPTSNVDASFANSEPDECTVTYHTDDCHTILTYMGSTNGDGEEQSV